MQSTNYEDTKFGPWCGASNDTKIRIREKQDLFDVMNFAVQMNISDLFIQTGKPILVSHHNSLTAISHVINPNDMKIILEILTNDEKVIYNLNSGRDYDAAVTIPDKINDHETINRRFRLNITSSIYDNTIGYQAVLRYIPPTIPDKKMVTLEDEILSEATPQQGGVLLLGEVGSGKTSTVAAILLEILKGNTNIKGNIVTYESPIEFDFNNIQSACCNIVQTEIPKHLPSFQSGARNSLRRKPSLVFLGELRDSETIEAANELMTTGVPLIGTAHANRVAVGYQRLVQKFPANLQQQAFYSLVSNIHMFVSQRIVHHAQWTIEKPKVICLREWQVITDELKQKIEMEGVERHVRVIQDFMNTDSNKYGRSMKTTVNIALKDNQITKETALRILFAYGYSSSDLI